MNNQDIVCVEDDIDDFQIVKTALIEAGVTWDILQAINASAALALARESSKRTMWIIKGKLPTDLVGRARIIGPQVAQEIRTIRWENELMMAFTTNPALFESATPSVVNHVFHKGRLWESIPQMTAAILQSSSEAMSPTI